MFGLYADDVAVFADSEQSLLAASSVIKQWANRWEMQFGVAKCGIISFTGPADNDQQGNPTVHWCPTLNCHRTPSTSHSVWTSTSNSEITTQIAGPRTRSGCGECIYLAPRWSLKWRSRSGPVVGWTELWSMQSMGTRHDNRALAATVS
ncbi:hypothetical protein BASA62_005418 [Batrachochytrium salamandrivorans]|nr:hypothetical protein BASA62_005418 [Batrachochytrium salamandrivorans]